MPSTFETAPEQSSGTGSLSLVCPPCPPPHLYGRPCALIASARSLAKDARSPPLDGLDPSDDAERRGSVPGVCSVSLSVDDVGAMSRSSRARRAKATGSALFWPRKAD